MPNIVIVDDSETTLAILRSLSAKIEGADAVAFSDPVAALEHLNNNAADLVFVDYSMPNMTGIELIKRLRKEKQHETTPIVMLTSSAEQAVRARAFEVGVTEFLTKPVRAADFKSCIAGFLRSGALVPA